MASLTEQEQQEIEEQNVIIDKIKNISEVDRIKIYCGEFLKYIEEKRYEKAYSLLNETFKNNYFKNINQFIEYVQNKYPQNNISVKYNNIERYGEVFLLDVEISQVLNNEFAKFAQRIVIKEISANEYKISFQVEPDENPNQVEKEGNIDQDESAENN